MHTQTQTHRHTDTQTHTHTHAHMCGIHMGEAYHDLSIDLHAVSKYYLMNISADIDRYKHVYIYIYIYI